MQKILSIDNQHRHERQPCGMIPGMWQWLVAVQPLLMKISRLKLLLQFILPLRQPLAMALLAALAVLPITAYSASKTVLVLGDSVSAEYGLERGQGWVTLMQQRCQQQRLDINFVNASISGETSSGGKTRLPALLEQHHPDLLIIELGGNDALRGLALTNTEANFRSMIKAAHEAKAKVLLLGMRIPPNWGRTYGEQFHAMYGLLAKQEQTALVPFLFEGIADKPELFQADRIHPVAAAQATLLDNVWPTLLPLLREKKIK
jgi:acyl-CoA thioesterase-1